MTEKLKVLDLFSGIGGFSLGLEATGGFETVAFCEIEEFPRKVLRKHWPKVPIYEDVRKLTSENGPKSVDIICGGYPCQPFSTAGKRKGKSDDRHLWPEVSRLMDEYRPSWGLFENVAGHVSMGLDDVLSDLEGKGYTTRTYIIPACALNAPHRRDRVWIVANASSAGARLETYSNRRCERETARTLEPEILPQRYRQGCSEGINSSRKDVANAECVGQQEQGRTERPLRPKKKRKGKADWVVSNCGWEAEPDVGRVANGFPNGMDRLKSLGNAVVPQIPEMIGRAILEAQSNEQ